MQQLIRSNHSGNIGLVISVLEMEAFGIGSVP